MGILIIRSHPNLRVTGCWMLFLCTIIIIANFLFFFFCTIFRTFWLVFDPAGETFIDKGTKLHILSLFQADVPEVVATAAAAGDSAILFSYLSKHPEEVRSKVMLKSAHTHKKKKTNWPANDFLFEAFPLTLLKLVKQICKYAGRCL